MKLQELRTTYSVKLNVIDRTNRDIVSCINRNDSTSAGDNHEQLTRVAQLRLIDFRIRTPTHPTVMRTARRVTPWLQK